MSPLAALVWVLCLLSAGLALVLVVLRFTSDLRERRRHARTAAVRDELLSMLMGEPDEAVAARARLAGLPPRRWDAAEGQVFGLLPKVRGESRGVLVDLLVERGAVPRAWALLSSRSPVRRCRGAHRLGALRVEAAVPALVAHLGDRAFLVRRVTLRALGSIASPEAVVPALHACGDDPGLTRDVVGALERIGAPGAPALRAELRSGLEAGGSRQGELAAIGLGLVGDVSATGLLVEALHVGSAGLRAAAAEALGRIGAPQAVDGLVSALDEPEDLVRRAAATALGDIGDPRACEGLARALAETGGSTRLTSRAVAAALLRIGAPGSDRLRRHASPYAAEALAVASLRRSAP